MTFPALYGRQDSVLHRTMKCVSCHAEDDAAVRMDRRLSRQLRAWQRQEERMVKLLLLGNQCVLIKVQYNYIACRMQSGAFQYNTVVKYCNYCFKLGHQKY